MPQAKLSIVSQVRAYLDGQATSNPQRKPIDWARTLQQLEVTDPETRGYTIDPKGVFTVFDGTRSTSIDGTTTFSFAPNATVQGRYRLTHTAGTNPGFRTARTLDLTGNWVTFTVNSNLSVTVTSGLAGAFTNVQDGDVVFVPGIATGDAPSPFSSLNIGYWTVLVATANAITLARFSGQVFEGETETVDITSADQLQAFSTSGVQIGDYVEFSNGFASAAQRSYAIEQVNPDWIEIVCTAPLGAQVGIVPGVGGMPFYSSAKGFLLLETDQECTVRLNNDAGNTNVVSPWIAGDETMVGEFRKTGAVWKLVVVNRATVPCNLTIITAE